MHGNPPNNAVQRLTVGIRRGEYFGMLGPVEGLMARNALPSKTLPC
jgi:hypothetical protein